MTDETLPNNPPNTDETNDNSSQGKSAVEETQPTEERTHHKRRRPRRTGGGQANVKATTEVTNSDLANTAQSEVVSIENEIADEAALSEGGIKAVGNQRIIGFMNIDKPMAIISGVMVLIAIVAIMVNGLNLGLDFTGGISADVVYEQPVKQTEVVQSLVDNGFNDPVVQYLGTERELLVRLPPQETNAEGLSESLEKALEVKNNVVHVESINIIGGQVGNEVYLNSLMAMGLALLCMLIYVAIRFQFKLSVGAVAALFHDAIVTLGVFAIFGFPFDLTVLAAVLALIGYSLNDTIVVYDRIRENFRRVRGLTPKKVVDLSLTETLRRTIMTSMTVILVVGAMMILGGDGLYWFSITLFIGLIAGTYSSVYIASAIPLMMGMSRDDFIVTVKPEFAEEVVTFEDKNAPIYDHDEV